MFFSIRTKFTSDSRIYLRFNLGTSSYFRSARHAKHAVVSNPNNVIYLFVEHREDNWNCLNWPWNLPWRYIVNRASYQIIVMVRLWIRNPWTFDLEDQGKELINERWLGLAAQYQAAIVEQLASVTDTAISGQMASQFRHTSIIQPCAAHHHASIVKVNVNNS